MSLELAEQAFRYAPTQDRDVAFEVLIEGLFHLIEGTREEIASLKREVETLKAAQGGNADDT